MEQNHLIIILLLSLILIMYCVLTCQLSLMVVVIGLIALGLILSDVVDLSYLR